MNFPPFGGAAFHSTPQHQQRFKEQEGTPPSSSPSTFGSASSPTEAGAAAARYQQQFGPPISVPSTDKFQHQQPNMLNNNHFTQAAFGQHVTQQPPGAGGPAEGTAPKGDSYQQQQLQMGPGGGQGAAMPATWQSLAAPGSTVADYLSHLPASTLPLSLHHFLKYSAESIKKETESTVTLPQHNQVFNQPASKKKKKKRPPKEKKPIPRPGEVRLSTALDGSTLFCCPECQLAYREKEPLEQHLLSHKLERRFICDICGAGLKRKDHLTRHKQSHNPDRPFVCTICSKAFKRKEQLTLHFVIHSGEKRHVCAECNKGFYRKDHLRKHARSHLARRLKAGDATSHPPQHPHAHAPPPDPHQQHHLLA